MDANPTNLGLYMNYLVYLKTPNIAEPLTGVYRKVQTNINKIMDFKLINISYNI